MAKQYFLFDDQNYMVKRLLDQNASGLSHAQRNSLYANQAHFFALGLSPIIKTIPKNGLFSSVALYKTDCQTAKDDDVIKICFLYIDLDFKEKDCQDALNFKQMRKDGLDVALVEKYQAEISIIQAVLSGFFGQLPFNLSLSGGGFHAHYLLDDAQGWTQKGVKHLEDLGSDALAKQGLNIEDIKNQVIDLEAWASLYKKIVGKLNEALKDTTLAADGVNFSPSRLLRDLGFKHLKDPSNPMFIKRIDDVSPFKADLKPLDPIKFNSLLAENQTPRIPTNLPTNQPVSHPPQKNQVNPLHTPKDQLYQMNIDDDCLDSGRYYNFKPSQRIYIYPKGKTQGLLISFSELLDQIQNKKQFLNLLTTGFIIPSEHEKGLTYNIQASLFEGDFTYQGKPADVGSIFITIRYQSLFKHNNEFATIEARIRNQVNSRYLEALDGFSMGVYPPRYFVNSTTPKKLMESIIDFIENKLGKKLYRFNRELALVDISNEKIFKVLKLDDLKIDYLLEAQWVGSNGKIMSFDDSSSILKNAYHLLTTSDRLPNIESISSLPLLDENFQVQMIRGYDEKTRSFIAGSSKLVDFKIDLSLSKEMMKESIKKDMNFLYDNFRFPTKTNEHFMQILGGLFQLFLGASIPEKPLISIVANTQGAGKSLLGSSMIAFITGMIHRPLPYDRNKDEFKSQIISHINPKDNQASNDIALVIDNVEGDLGGGWFNSVLTSGGTIKIRPKYSATMIEARIPFSFIVTGNNMSYSDDTGRRTFQISLETSGYGLANETYRYTTLDGKTTPPLRDNAYLKHLASLHEEGQKTLIRLLAYSHALKDEYQNEIVKLTRMASFSGIDPIVDACFVIAKTLNFTNCDLLNLNNADMEGQTKDIESYDTFISSLQSLLEGESKDFSRTHINLKVKDLLDPTKAQWRNEADKILIDQLESARIIEGGKLASKSQLDRLFNQCRGKKSKAGFTLKKLEKTTGGSAWYSIEKVKITTRPLLYDHQVERVEQKVERVERVERVEQFGQMKQIDQVGQVKQIDQVEQMKQVGQVGQAQQVKPILTTAEAQSLANQVNQTLEQENIKIDFVYNETSINPSIKISPVDSNSSHVYPYKEFINIHLNQKYKDQDQDILHVIKSLYKHDLGRQYLRAT